MVLSLLLSLVLLESVFLGALKGCHVRCRRYIYDRESLFYKAISILLLINYILYDINKAHSIQVRGLPFTIGRKPDGVVC